MSRDNLRSAVSQSQLPELGYICMCELDDHFDGPYSRFRSRSVNASDLVASANKSACVATPDSSGFKYVK